MKKCNSCNAVLRDEALFCSFCGSSELSPLTQPRQVCSSSSPFKALLKALLCAVIFLGTQLAVTFVYLLVATIFISSGTHLTADELSWMLSDMLTQHAPIISIISNILTVALFAIYFLLRHRKLHHELGMRRCPFILIPLCAVLGYALQYVIVIITMLLPWPEEWLTSHAESTSAAMTGGLLLIILSTSVITAFSEETVFRAISMEHLGRAFGCVATVIISAVIFGAAHLSPIAMFYATVLGIIIGAIYRRFRSVWPCITVHLFFNLAATLGLPSSSLLLYLSIVAISFGVSIIAIYLILARIDARAEIH